MQKIAHLKTFAADHIPPGVMTLDELARAFNFPLFDDPEGESTDTLYDLNFDEIEDRAIEGACYALGYVYDHTHYTITGPCTLCKGEGELPDSFEPGELVTCPTCKGTGKMTIPVDTVRESTEYEKAADDAADRLYSGYRRAVESSFESFLKGNRLELETVQIRYLNTGRAHGGPTYWYEAAYRFIPLQTGFMVRPMQAARKVRRYTWRDVAESLFTGRGLDSEDLKTVNDWRKDEGHKSFKALVLAELPNFGYDEDQPKDHYSSHLDATLNYW